MNTEQAIRELKVLKTQFLMREEAHAIDKAIEVMEGRKGVDLSVIFRNYSDCYADTWKHERGLIEEGDVIQAMTERGFIEAVNSLNRPQSETEGTEL